MGNLARKSRTKGRPIRTLLHFLGAEFFFFLEASSRIDFGKVKEKKYLYLEHHSRLTIKNVNIRRP